MSVRAIRKRITTEHTAIVDGIDYCADQVTEPWDSAETTAADQIVDPLRQVLDATGIHSQLPHVLTDVVRAAGYDLRAQPVPAPPYVVVTSRGPLLRATIDPGRLVIRFDVFAVVRDPTPTYRRRNGVCVEIALR